MKILVFGNVGSGKTTVLNKLKEEYTFELVSIDDYRRKFGDGSKEGEAIASINFYGAIKKKENQIIESIGVGVVSDKLFELLYGSDELIICLILLVSKEICHSRLSVRNWDVPFPHPLENVYSLIERTDAKIGANEIQNKWSKRKNTIITSKNNNESRDLKIILSEIISIVQQNSSLI